MISLFTSIKNMTPWGTRVLRSFDGKHRFTAELCKKQSQTLRCWDLSEPEEVMSSSSEQSPSEISNSKIPSLISFSFFPLLNSTEPSESGR